MTLRLTGPATGGTLIAFAYAGAEGLRRSGTARCHPSIAYADNPLGAHWSTPAPIPGFNSAVANPAFQRYTDPWVSFAPNGDVYASAIGISLSGGLPSMSARPR